VRHEATAVFAADACARLTGIPGVAAVTAGPGATNTITAVKNAQMAQSPLVLLGGAVATALKGRGALQDIDQMALFRPHVKWTASVRRLRELVPLLHRAFRIAASGVPGPVFLEIPVDLLYAEALVRDWYLGSASGKSLAARAMQFYLRRHCNRLFAGADRPQPLQKIEPAVPEPDTRAIRQAAQRLHQAKRPLLLVGSQALLQANEAAQIAAAVQRLGVPVYLSGMARGLLGREHALHLRHQRRQALKEADLVLLAGVPCDFRLNYGQHIPRRAFLISANRSRRDLQLNRRPDLGVCGDAGRFLQRLAGQGQPQPAWQDWLQHLRQRDAGRDAEIRQQAGQRTEPLNPIRLCLDIDSALAENSVLVGDGGDFVATAAYTLRPRGPLRWLDPGVFGTLGVGAGFALAAKLCRPEAEVWIIYGDGSLAYSIAEFDTFVRHKVPVIAVVGNDASWQQIAREQVEILEDDVGTVLRRSDYHRVAEGFGGQGIALVNPGDTAEVLSRARAIAAEGQPVLINAHIGKTEFRKGAISM